MDPIVGAATPALAGALSLETMVSAGLARQRGTRARGDALGDDGAEDTGNVTSSKGDTELLELVVLVLGLADGLVDLGDGGLEGPELDHGVGDLTTPEGRQRLVEGSGALRGGNLLETVDGSGREGGEGRLHADLDGLHLHGVSA